MKQKGELDSRQAVRWNEAHEKILKLKEEKIGPWKMGKMTERTGCSRQLIHKHLKKIPHSRLMGVYYFEPGIKGFKEGLIGKMSAIENSKWTLSLPMACELEKEVETEPIMYAFAGNTRLSMEQLAQVKVAVYNKLKELQAVPERGTLIFVIEPP